MEKGSTTIFELQLTLFIDSLRPEDKNLRKQVDFGYSWDGKTAILFEIRPQFNDVCILREYSFAKIRYVKSSDLWKLYWKRQSNKWATYDHKAETTNLLEILREIEKDEFGCFFG